MKLYLVVPCAFILASCGSIPTHRLEREVNDSQSLTEQRTDLRLIADVFQAVKSGFVDPIDDKKLTGACLSGMTTGIDPESAYLDADAFRELQIQPGLGSIGLDIQKEDGVIKVIDSMEDTPAFRAGISIEDEIITIDDRTTTGLTLTQIRKALQGIPGTEVALTIKRPGQDDPIHVVLKREKIRAQTVWPKLLDNEYIYIRLTQFQENTRPTLVKQLQEYYQQHHISGFILDLRNSPGGLLEAGVGIAAVFLTPGSLVISTYGRLPDSNRNYQAIPKDFIREGKNYLTDLPSGVKNVPLVVIVNKRTAAGAEIVAAALQDHKRAMIYGTPTFGRDTIQTVFPIASDSAIKVTTSRWLSPNGKSVHQTGVVPDISFMDKGNKATKTRKGEDPQILQALSILKNSKAD